MDENTTLDWFGDDNSTTADEGINQLLPDELKGTTNEMIKMDRTRPGNYTIQWKLIRMEQQKLTSMVG